MELAYDWKSFQSIFYSKKRFTSLENPGTIYLITEGKTIISAFSEGEDLSDWTGATADELIAEISHRELVFYNRDQVDQWMSQAVGRSHYYDQLQFLCAEVKPQKIIRNRFKHPEMIRQEHFLLKALQTWWNRVLPSNYGVYIRLEGSPVGGLLVIVQRGKVDSFHVPDLSSMVAERRKYPGDVVKFLSERHLVPIQGIYLTAAQWAEWSEMQNPWHKIAIALRNNRNILVPFKWSLASLIASRAYLAL